METCKLPVENVLTFSSICSSNGGHKDNMDSKYLMHDVKPYTLNNLNGVVQQQQVGEL